MLGIGHETLRKFEIVDDYDGLDIRTCSIGFDC